MGYIGVIITNFNFLGLPSSCWFLSHPLETFAGQNGFIFPQFSGWKFQTIFWSHHLVGESCFSGRQPRKIYSDHKMLHVEGWQFPYNLHHNSLHSAWTIVSFLHFWNMEKNDGETSSNLPNNSNDWTSQLLGANHHPPPGWNQPFADHLGSGNWKLVMCLAAHVSSSGERSGTKPKEKKGWRLTWMSMEVSN